MKHDPAKNMKLETRSQNSSISSQFPSQIRK